MYTFLLSNNTKDLRLERCQLCKMSVVISNSQDCDLNIYENINFTNHYYDKIMCKITEFKK